MSLEQGTGVDGRVVYHQAFSPPYHQVQKYMWKLSVAKIWAQFEAGCSGSAAFVDTPSGCFLRKLLWPVCWFHQKVLNRNCGYLYIAQPQSKWGLLTFRPFFSLFLLHHLSCVLHMVTQPWASTQYSREKRATAVAKPKHQEPVQPVSGYCSSSVQVMLLFQAKGIGVFRRNFHSDGFLVAPFTQSFQGRNVAPLFHLAGMLLFQCK